MTVRTAEMAGWSYTFRPSVLSGERNYRLDADSLVWDDAKRHGRVAYREIDRMHIYKERFLGSSASYWSSVLYCRSGKKIRLGAAHRAPFRSIEDRTATYIPFVKELEARVQRFNPNATFQPGSYWLSRREDIAARTAVALLRGTRRLNPDRCGAIAAGVMRVLGPWLQGHRLARANLAAAYPEKSAAEIEKILSGMWDNLARSIAEYSHLDRLWDYDFARPNTGRIVMDQSSADLLSALSKDRKPALFFAAHLANWELPAVVLPSLGREGALLYKPPTNAALAEELLKIRKKCMGTLIPADVFTVFRLNDAIQRGACLGMLVDQHHAGGVEVTFFGRVCKVNSMVARLARSFDCPIYGARMIRLSGDRFRYELTGPIDPPRDNSGKIDVARTMQLITLIVEEWIREHPEQWLWLHRRWR